MGRRDAVSVAGAVGPLDPSVAATLDRGTNHTTAIRSAIGTTTGDIVTIRLTRRHPR